MPLLKERVAKGLKIILEPGRSIVCHAAILLARVQYTKKAGTKKYVIVDAAMNDLIRPTLYESYHFIWPTGRQRGDGAGESVEDAAGRRGVGDESNT